MMGTFIIVLFICFFFVPKPVLSNDNTTHLGPSIIEKQFDVKKDAADINAASKQNPINLIAIIDILTKRTVKQRIEIKKSYNVTYGKPLPTTLMAISDWKLKYFFVRLLYSPAEYAARDIRFSLGFEQDWSYMSILCTTYNVQLKKIVETFHKVYNKDLTSELDEKMKIDSGKEFLKRMIGLGDHGRPKSGVNPNIFDGDIGYIPTKGAHCSIYKNGDLFNVLTMNSFEHISKFVEYYHNKENVGVYDLMEEHCGEGETKEGYLKILRYAFDPIAYFAIELYDGISSQRATKEGMDRIIITRSEIDLLDIQKSFVGIYNVTVPQAIDVIYGDHDKNYTYALKSMLTGNK